MNYKILFVLILPVLFLALTSCSTPIVLNDKSAVQGVWWWDDSLDYSYLEFAHENGIDEIYYCDSSFDADTESFIQKSNALGINVYFLCGEYQWIENRDSFDSLISSYIEFQNNHTYIFEGVHLDVEPHQHPQFAQRRTELIAEYINFILQTTSKYPNIKFDADIPFWLDDVITFAGQTKEAYKFLIDYCNRTFIMSYRDTAQGIYDVAKDELEYAKTVNKMLFLGVETGDEEDVVTFAQENKKYMYDELKKLYNLVDYNYGLSIHHIKSWYELKSD